MTTPKTPPAPAHVPNGTQTGLTETLQRPVVGGTVTSGFGQRERPTAGASSNHKGVDIAVPVGTDVHAAASGTVSFAGQQSGYGNVVIIDHGDGTQTKYAHLSQIDVQRGQHVVGGETVARSGGARGAPGSGTSTGPHLHYEVVKNGTQVNPLANNTAVDLQQRATTAPADQMDIEQRRRQITLNYDQDEIIKKLISGEHFTDNPANDYDNLTYHWRLFMTTDSEILRDDATSAGGSFSEFANKLNTYEQVTIAESGVTTYSIDEVTMEAVCGPDPQVGSSTITQIEMKVTEPNGVNFIDSLRNAGLKLGVRNYQKALFYLELTFKDYNEDGTINTQPFADNFTNGGHWIWTVRITDIDVGLSAGGGSYTLKLVRWNDGLLIGTYNVVPATVIPSGGTVGEFFESLCDKLNKTWALIKGDPGIIQYKVKFHPVADLLTADEVKAMPITPDQQDLNPVQGFSFASGSPTATIAQGFTISSILDTVMLSCEKAQKLAVDELLDTASGQKAYNQSVLWRVEPEMHSPNYDPIFNEYYQHITLHIYGYRNHSAVMSPKDTLTREDAQKAILADMANRRFLPKKYEYLFTGVNSEVIDMNLNFNLTFQALLPNLASNTQEQAAVQARAQPAAAPVPGTVDASTQRAQAQAASAQTVAGGQQAASTARISADKDLFEALEEQRQKGGPGKDPDLDARITALRTAAQQAQTKLLQADAVTSAKRSELMSGRPASTPQNNLGRTYAEDLQMNQSQFRLEASRANEVAPITVQAYVAPAGEGLGLHGQFHDGKSAYGALLNQVFGPVAKQFFRVEVTIKGDPYWIGNGTYEDAVLRNTDNFDGTLPNFAAGANCFLFRLRYPLGMDSETDTPVILNNETVSAIYQVIRVSHRFVDGKFTQVLTANQLPIVDLFTTLYKSTYDTGGTNA